LKAKNKGAGMTQESGKPMDEIVDRHHRRRTSLRARITLATTITAVIAAVVVGYFAFIRNEATQTFLGEQFQDSVKEKAESQIQALVSQEAQRINQFFIDVDQSVILTATYTANLLNQPIPIIFEDELNSDAAQELFRLPNGAWGNPNYLEASIFAPSHVVINEQLRSELRAVSKLGLITADSLKFNPNIIALYFGSREDLIIYYPNIDLVNVVPPDFKPTEQPFYTNATSVNINNVVWSLPFHDPSFSGLTVTNSTPVFDQSNTFRGVIGADVQISRIIESIEDIDIGTTGYAFLIDSEGRILAMPDSGYQDFELVREEIPVNEVPQQTLLGQGSQDIKLLFQSMAQGGLGLTRVRVQGTERYVAYAPILSPKYSLGIIVPVSEMDATVREAQSMVTQENQETQNFGLLLLVIVAAVATLISFLLSQVLTNPLNLLTATAEQVSAGNLRARAPLTTVNEVNVVADAFNAMTDQLRGMLTGLEERVSERTLEIEAATLQSQRRAAQFEAVAQVARNISTSQDLETLLPKITNVISQQFGYYHVGVFLLDEAREFAVFRAANSSGGNKMLERNHQLKVGETSIVGFATSRGKPRIALDTGVDAVYFDNPDLPETRSEMALPMIVGEQEIGALDVQSVAPNAFSRDDIDTLTTLADQVGIAIRNAQLFEETSNALAKSQLLSQQITSTGWRQFTRSHKLAGIRRSKAKATLLKRPLEPDQMNGQEILNLPIELRGQKIGELKIQAKDNRQWTQDEIDIASAIIERAAIAMENSRLLAEAQRRATRERVIGEIASTVSSSTDMEEILRNAVQELGRRMGGAEVVLELGTYTSNDQQNEPETEAQE